jgi:hypothetical protein
MNINCNNILTNEKFIKFLKKNNAYDKFRINYLNSEYLYCNDIILYNYLYESFSWSKTKEGFNYWNNLNNKWHKYIK